MTKTSRKSETFQHSSLLGEPETDTMPCAECGHLLIVSHKHEDLRCPQCLNLDVEDQQILEDKIKQDRELLRDENIAKLLEDYSKDNLLLYLIERLNRIAHQFYQTRSLDQKEFSYLNYLIKIAYPKDKSEFGDVQLEPEEGLDEEINTLLDTQAELVTGLNHIEDQFRICCDQPISQDSKFLFGEYDIRDSEYRYCYWRCLRSLSAGKIENREIFDKTCEKIRDFDTPDVEEIETLEEFANVSFEFIISLLFMASANDVVGDIYTTFPPDHVSIFDIRDFLNNIDEQFTNDNNQILLQDHTLGWTNEDGLSNAGEETFHDSWEDVRDTVVVSQENLDAHPFLFELDAEIPWKKPAGRPPLTREKTRIVYPRFYSRILQYQIFPLLQNGDQPSGHEILNQVSTERGLEFERNVYTYLTNQGFNCFHSAEIPGIESSEIDVLAINNSDNEIWFIECKYLLPEIQMNTAEGIENLNSKFDHKVFNEDADAYNSSPTGQPFPDKVDEWLSLESGNQFTWQENPGTSNTTDALFQEQWFEMDVRMMVVSNLVPSYLEKHGVEFMTDMELVERIEDDDPERYHAKHDMV